MTTNDEPRSAGWFKACRTSEALELIKRNKNAFVLAYIIAFRARWKDSFNADELKPGEALLGDYSQCGMSEREYRTAKEKLVKWGFSTFRKTNRGTIGRLTDTRLFDPLNIINDGQNAKQPADSRRTADGQPTTNYKEKKEKTEATNAAALTGAERISMERELERIAERLKEIEGEASADAWGAHYDEKQKAEREKLKGRRTELKQLLGVVI